MPFFKKILLLVILAVFFSNASLISSLSKEIITFWFEQLVPSMFVSITIIQLLSTTSFFTSLAMHFRFLCPFLHLNEEALGLVFSCLMMGCPANIALIHQAYQSDRITEKMALRLNYCTPVATISFLIMNVGGGMYNSSFTGFILWIIQILSCFVLLYLTKSTPIDAAPLLAETEKKHSLTSALSKSGMILFLIGGYLLMFQTVSALLHLFIPHQFQNFIQVISEFSYGCFLITNQYPFQTSFVLISALCGFNGLCVQFQAISLSEIRIPVFHYLLYRIVQAFIATVISITVLPLLL